MKFGIRAGKNCLIVKLSQVKQRGLLLNVLGQYFITIDLKFSNQECVNT